MPGGTRLVRNVSAGGVAAIAAWSSYSHMVHVALTFGERPEVAYALPFSVDGMLMVATVVMVDDKRRNRQVRPAARVAFAAGVLASVAANIAAAHPSVGARVVAAWPAVALLLVVEMLARPPVPAAAEVSPATAARGVAAAERMQTAPAAAETSAEVPPSSPAALTSAGADASPSDRQPAPAADPAHATATASTSTSAPAALAAGSGHGSAGHLPAAAPPHPAPPLRTAARTRTPLAVVPPAGTAVPPVGTGVAPPLPPDPPQRREHRDVPAAEPTGAPLARDYRVQPPAVNRRRPAAATRHLARQIIEAEPHLTRTEVAARLGVSARRLREVLATPA
jgi:hypothetical protein